MLDFCLVGAGPAAQDHARYIATCEGMRLCTVADPQLDAARALATLYGANAMADPKRALANGETNAVLLAASGKSNSELISRAVKAGKAVFFGRPIDLDLEQARTVVREVANAKSPVLVDFPQRFDPHYAALEQAVRSGQIGNVELITITNRLPAPPADPLEAPAGFLFREVMVHDLDLARWLLGEEPVEVFALGSCLIEPQWRERGEIDSAVVVLKTASGKLCQINNGWRATYGRDHRVEVHGSAGMVRAGSLGSNVVERFNASLPNGEVLQYFFSDRYAEARRRALTHFVDVVTNGKTPLTVAEDGRRALVLADAALQSTRNGQPVAIKY